MPIPAALDALFERYILIATLLDDDAIEHGDAVADQQLVLAELRKTLNEIDAFLGSGHG